MIWRMALCVLGSLQQGVVSCFVVRALIPLLYMWIFYPLTPDGSYTGNIPSGEAPYITNCEVRMAGLGQGAVTLL